MMMLRRASNMLSRSQNMQRSCFSGIPNLEDQVVGRQREELEGSKDGKVYYNRDAVATTEADGNSADKPICIPSYESERAIGISHNDSSYLMWFPLKKGKVHYVPQVEKYFYLFNPSEVKSSKQE